jgi:hypothetical protein
VASLERPSERRQALVRVLWLSPAEAPLLVLSAVPAWVGLRVSAPAALSGGSYQRPLIGTSPLDFLALTVDSATRDFVIASGVAIAICIWALCLGILRWTGRLRKWADPNKPNPPEIFLWGRSPLTPILLSVGLLSAFAGAFALNWSFTIATIILVLVTVPSFVLMFGIRVFRPSWSEPPWLEQERWERPQPSRRSPRTKKGR